MQEGKKGTTIVFFSFFCSDQESVSEQVSLTQVEWAKVWQGPVMHVMLVMTAPLEKDRLAFKKRLLILLLLLTPTEQKLVLEKKREGTLEIMTANYELFFEKRTGESGENQDLSASCQSVFADARANVRLHLPLAGLLSPLFFFPFFLHSKPTIISELSISRSGQLWCSLTHHHHHHIQNGCLLGVQCSVQCSVFSLLRSCSKTMH